MTGYIVLHMDQKPKAVELLDFNTVYNLSRHHFSIYIFEEPLYTDTREERYMTMA